MWKGPESTETVKKRIRSPREEPVTHKAQREAPCPLKMDSTTLDTGMETNNYDENICLPKMSSEGRKGRHVIRVYIERANNKTQRQPQE